MIRRLLLVLLLALTTPALAAISPDEMLKDPALEARARALAKQLRCLVCQNQSIDDSDADLAADLRKIVRERLAAGESEAEIKAYLVARYGDFVLLAPPMRPETWLLWFGPPLVLVAGGVLVIGFLRRRRAAPTIEPELDAEERSRLDALLGEGERGERA